MKQMNELLQQYRRERDEARAQLTILQEEYTWLEKDHKKLAKENFALLDYIGRKKVRVFEQKRALQKEVDGLVEIKRCA